MNIEKSGVDKENKEAQKHRRETADVHSDNTENNRSSGGIFSKCDKIIIFGKSHSYAEQFAKDNDGPFVAE